MAESGRERYWRQVRESASVAGVDINEARRRWRERRGAGAAAAVRRATERVVVRTVQPLLRLVAREVDAVTVCPYCRDDLGADPNDVLSCRCGTRYHIACAVEAHRCAVLGCRKVFAVPAPPRTAQPAPTQVVTRQEEQASTAQHEEDAVETDADVSFTLPSRSSGYELSEPGAFILALSLIAVAVVVILKFMAIL